MGTDRMTRQTDDTEANTIVRPLYLFISNVIIKEGQTKKRRRKWWGRRSSNRKAPKDED
jgi:hypothetical protein